MGIRKIRNFILPCSLIMACGFFSTAWALLTQQFKADTDKKIDSLRKGDITICVKNPDPLPGAQITVKQIGHHFGFGAALPLWPLRRDSSMAVPYAKSFLRYFEWATPENEMKWQNTDKSDSCGQYFGPDYQDADALLSWCRQNGLKVRGHCLFWNEKPDWQPGWVQCLTGDIFKAAMKTRIDTAMTHFKGKVDHWDLINEIIHGGASGGEVVIPGYYAQKTGDTNIFSWVVKNARAIDPKAKLTVNEYNIIEKWSDLRKFTDMINKMKNEGGDIDIIGLEGHFGAFMNREDYSKKIDSVAMLTNHKEIWLTEVDFQFTENKEDSLEELMRYAFAHPDIGGLCLWMWWEGNRWRNVYTSFFVDSSFDEVPLGARWRTLKDSAWTTNTAGNTDEKGEFKFRGFFGKYEITTTKENKTRKDTVNFIPDSALSFFPPDPTAIISTAPAFTEKKILVSGKKVILRLPPVETPRLFVCTYSLSGKLLQKIPIALNQSVALNSRASTGCYIYRIESEKEIFYTAKGLHLR